MVLRAIESHWPSTPGKRAKLYEVAYEIAIDKEEPSRTRLRAVACCAKLEGQNLQIQLSEDQLRRTIAAIEARLRYQQQLPESPHPLILDQQHVARTPEDLERFRETVVAELMSIESERGQPGHSTDPGGNGQGGNGNGRAD